MALTWNAGLPVSSTCMAESVEQIRANWDDMNLWWDVQHHAFESATSGRHTVTADNPGVLASGAQAVVDALDDVTVPGTGALAHNTTLGEVQAYYYDSATSATAWEGITDRYSARMRKAMGEQTIPITAWTQVVCAGTADDTYDSLSAWSNYRYTIPTGGAGYYLVSLKVVWEKTTSNYNIGIAIYVSGNRISEKRLYGNGVVTMVLEDVLSLAAADYVQAKVWHNHSSTVEIASAILHIQRVS